MKFHSSTKIKLAVQSQTVYLGSFALIKVVKDANSVPVVEFDDIKYRIQLYKADVKALIHNLTEMVKEL